VERLCRLEDEAAALRSAVRAEGVVLKLPIQTAKGEIASWQTIPNPALLPLRKIGAELPALGAALGMTPHGRQTLGLEVIGEPPPPDALDELKARYQRERAAMKAAHANGGGA